MTDSHDAGTPGGHSLGLETAAQVPTERSASTTAIIGLGAMGSAIAGRLLDVDRAVTVYSRTASRAEVFAERGARAAESVSAAVHAAGVVITVLPTDVEVLDVYFGREGVLASARPGTVILDGSTVSPSVSRRIAARAIDNDLAFADVGLGGLPHHAAAGELSLMFGCLPEHVEAVRAILRPLGRTAAHCGPPGAGMTTKLINNLLATTIHVADLEAITLAERAGLDIDTFLTVIGSTMAGNRQLHDRIPGELSDRSFEPGFRIALALKDFGLGLQLASELNVPIQALASGGELLSEARARGYDDKSVTVLLHTLREKLRDGEAGELDERGTK